MNCRVRDCVIEMDWRGKGVKDISLHVGHCAECGADITSDQLQQMRRVAMLVGELLLHIMLTDTMVNGDDAYEAVRPGWRERLSMLEASIEGEMSELQDFGEAYDEEE